LRSRASRKGPNTFELANGIERHSLSARAQPSASPKRRPHLNSSRSSYGTLVCGARIVFTGFCHLHRLVNPFLDGAQSGFAVPTRALFCTRAATAKPRARTLATRMCLPLLIFMVDSQARPTHVVRTKVATAKPRASTLAPRRCMLLLIFLVPQRGFEPLTHALRMRCSTN
jgi:hypothetical protein